MKNIIRSISLALVMLVAITTIGAAHANSTASVQNNTPENLGSVAIYAAGSPYYVNVPGPGVFNVQVPSTPDYVVVNHFIIPQGQYAIITAPSGRKVRVTVTGSIIVVGDTQEGN